MIDSANVVMVALPVNGLYNPSTEKVQENKVKNIVGPNEKFAPIKGKTIITESGYVVNIPVMIGSSTKVTKLGMGYYLVSTRPSVYGAKPKTKIMTEEELVEKFHGVKLPKLGKDEKNSVEEKIQQAIINLLNTDPKIYLNA